MNKKGDDMEEERKEEARDEVKDEVEGDKSKKVTLINIKKKKNGFLRGLR